MTGLAIIPSAATFQTAIGMEVTATQASTTHAQPDVQYPKLETIHVTVLAIIMPATTTEATATIAPVTADILFLETEYATAPTVAM